MRGTPRCGSRTTGMGRIPRGRGRAIEHRRSATSCQMAPRYAEGRLSRPAIFEAVGYMTHGSASSLRVGQLIDGISSEPLGPATIELIDGRFGAVHVGEHSRGDTEAPSALDYGNAT